jgi:hypothetical protein
MQYQIEQMAKYFKKSLILALAHFYNKWQLYQGGYTQYSDSRNGRKVS